MKTAKRIIYILIICIILTGILASNVYAAPELTIKSDSGIVINTETGQIIYAKNEDVRVKPGGLTKLMTVYLAADECTNGGAERSDVVKITDRMLVESDMPLIKVGNAFTVEQLMYLAHFDVDPTAAKALAIYLGGTEGVFAESMTKAAVAFGCTDTNFCNAAGQADENQYTTAHDMAKIIMGALNNKLFRTVFSAHMYILPKDESGVENTILTNNELQVRTSNAYSEYCTGGKVSCDGDPENFAVATGESKDANFEVIAVTANGNSMSDIFGDLKNMLAWSIDNYKLMRVLSTGEVMATIPVTMGVEGKEVYAGPSADINFLVEKDGEKSDFSFEIRRSNDGDLSAPVNKGDILGEIIIFYRGEEYGKVGLAAIRSISLDKGEFAKNKVAETLLSPVSIIAFILFFAVVVLYFLYAIKYRKQLENDRRERISIMAMLANERRRAAEKTKEQSFQYTPPACLGCFNSEVKTEDHPEEEHAAPVIYTYPADTVFAGFFTDERSVVKQAETRDPQDDFTKEENDDASTQDNTCDGKQEPDGNKSNEKSHIAAV